MRPCTHWGRQGLRQGEATRLSGGSGDGNSGPPRGGGALSAAPSVYPRLYGRCPAPELGQTPRPGGAPSSLLCGFINRSIEAVVHAAKGRRPCPLRWPASTTAPTQGCEVLPCTRFPTSFGRLVHSGRVRLQVIVRVGAMLAFAVALSLLAATLEGGSNMIADTAVNISVAIGVAVGGRVEGSTLNRSHLGCERQTAVVPRLRR